MKKGPLIGIPNRILHDSKYSIEVQGGCSSYVQSIIEAGGVPIAIPLNPGINVEVYSELCDGMLFSGGEDVDPSLYGEKAAPHLGRVSRIRDDVELALFHAVRKKGKPILGICRGLQLINVALKGSLIQDIPSEVVSTIEHTHEEDRWLQLIHTVDIVEGSRLSRIFDAKEVRVNSIHHQSIKAVGDTLMVSGVSKGDGIIEAVEASDGYPLIAVQWHPEVLWQEGSEVDLETKGQSRRLFQWLVENSF